MKETSKVVVLITTATEEEAHSIASLSVLPSRSEGFGIAVLEAMGC